MVGVVAQTVPGDGVEVDTVVGDQQVKAPLSLSGIVVAAEVVDKVVDQLVIDHLVIDAEDIIHHVLQSLLQTVDIAAGCQIDAGVDGRLSRLLILLQERGGVHVHDAVQNGIDAVLERLIIRQHLTVRGHRVLVRGHLGGKTGHLLIQRQGEVREDGLVQEPVQRGRVIVAQYFLQRALQRVGAASDVLILHVGHGTVRDLGEVVGQRGGVVSTDVELIVVDAHAPHILVGVAAQAGAQIADGAVGEIGVVVLAAYLLKALVLVHAVQVDGVIQIVVQQLEVAAGGDLRQVQHGIVVGTQIQVPVIDPQVAGHGVVDAQAEAVLAGLLIADDLGPGEAAVGVLVAAVHGKALLVDLAVDALVGDHRDIQVTVVLDDVPDAAAVEAVGLHDRRQAVEVVLIGDDVPLAETGTGITAGHDDAAGSALSVVVVGGQAHQYLAVIDHQAVDAVGDTGGIADVVVGDAGLVGLGIHFQQRGGGIAHAGEVQLALELTGHAVAGQVVLHRQQRGVAGENVRILAPQLPLPEDHLGLAGVLVHRDDDGIPVVALAGYIKGIHAEHDLDDIRRHLVGIDILVQSSFLLHVLQGGLHVVLEDKESRVVAGADIDIIAVITAVRHGPGIGVAPVLVLAGEDTVDLAGAQCGMRDLIDGVATVGIYSLFGGYIADIALVISGDIGCCRSRKYAQQHDGRQERDQFLFHDPSPVFVFFFSLYHSQQDDPDPLH